MVDLLEEAVQAAESGGEPSDEVWQWLGEGLTLYAAGVGLERALGLEGEGGSRSAQNNQSEKIKQSGSLNLAQSSEKWSLQK